jgi:hypothetical protein
MRWLRGIINRLCGLEGDKYVHFIVCLINAHVIANVLSLGSLLSAAIGMLIAILIGCMKELADDHIDRNDIKADIAGAVVGGILSLI